MYGTVECISYSRVHKLKIKNSTGIDRNIYNCMYYREFIKDCGFINVIKGIVTVKSSGLSNSTDRFWAPDHRLYL